MLVASGRPYGAFVWGGRSRVLPGRLRVASAVTVALYVLFGVIIVARAQGGTTAESTVVSVGIWLLVVIFALGIVANAVSRSRSERAAMVPANVVLAAAALVLAL